MTHYRVDISPGTLRAYVVDARTNAIVLTLGGPDRLAVAEDVAAVLNGSPTETPVEVSR